MSDDKKEPCKHGRWGFRTVGDRTIQICMDCSAMPELPMAEEVLALRAEVAGMRNEVNVNKAWCVERIDFMRKRLDSAEASLANHKSLIDSYKRTGKILLEDLERLADKARAEVKADHAHCVTPCDSIRIQQENHSVYLRLMEILYAAKDVLATGGTSFESFNLPAYMRRPFDVMTQLIKDFEKDYPREDVRA